MRAKKRSPRDTPDGNLVKQAKAAHQEKPWEERERLRREDDAFSRRWAQDMRQVGR
jgi:hypothetical protein